MRFFHLMHDDKFFDAVVELFLAFPHIENIFIAGTDDDDYKVKYIKSDLIRVIRYGSQEYERVRKTIRTEDAVVVHYLDRQKSEIINAIQSKPVIVWFSFGAELYTSISYPNHLYLPLTKLLLAADPTHQLRTVRDTLKLLISRYLPGYRKTSIERAIGRVDYFATPLPSETQLFKQYLPGLKAKEVFFQYGSLESILESALQFSGPLGNGIFVGNSNTPTSNHADAFKFIRRHNFRHRKIVVPLSYGGDPFYRASVIFLGKLYFNRQFESIKGFLNKADFSEKISLCRTAIFMHIRQQAIGNILFCLWMGLKVFVLRTNPCYHYYRSLGIHIYAIDDCEDPEFDSELKPDLKQRNKEILMKEFGEKEVLKKIGETIRIVSGSRGHSEN